MAEPESRVLSQAVHQGERARACREGPIPWRPLHIQDAPGLPWVVFLSVLEGCLDGMHAQVCPLSSSTPFTMQLHGFYFLLS